jgi:phenylacetate-CoA ligase
LFDGLVHSEFFAPGKQRARQWRAMRRLLQIAEARVPYYRRRFEESGIGHRDLRGLDDLHRLPVLTREELQEQAAEFRATSLPIGEREGLEASTSGSTGQPVRVLHSATSASMFRALKQREIRWFRFDPSKTLLVIRAAADLPPQRNGKPMQHGRLVEFTAWPTVGNYFQTGPCVGFRTGHPLETQIEWLEQIQPAYLLANAADLEHLALGYGDRAPPTFLEGLQGVSQELTPEMRERITGVFGVPVHENYGLNEVGIVASRCPEGGRFHVHAEHCLAEIVDEAGRPCEPGERGHLVVTSLTNVAMPIVRYDTGDLAEAVAGECPCGRTLPTFGRIHGRYRRVAYLPPGTWTYWGAFQVALATMAPEVYEPLRQYQLHQFREGHFELRVVATRPLPDAFSRQVHEAWGSVGEGAPPPLRIVEVEEIPRPPGGKFQNFTSDFMPPRGE